MPEPFDTIQRINVDVDSMTLSELQRARALLDEWTSTRRADVREARRKVGARIEKLTGQPAPMPNAYEPARTPTPSPTSLIQNEIYTGNLRPPKEQKKAEG